ncbi:MAG: hypothetical protein U1F83_00360 [Verrucomicrobiota bacterium]
MSSDLSGPVTRSRRKWPVRLLIAAAFVAVACFVYVRAHPLVFNESFFMHAHCIPQAGGSLLAYAGDHSGKFPTHTNGYGDALLLLVADDPTSSYILTGPGYDAAVFDRALANHTDVPEAECGRVYVQGLSETNNPELVVLFDKIPTPGGDHCHGLRRLRAPLCREVLFVDGGHDMILESKWQEFASNQVELLVKEGFERSAAEAVYAEKGKEH